MQMKKHLLLLCLSIGHAGHPICSLISGTVADSELQIRGSFGGTLQVHMSRVQNPSRPRSDADS